MLERACRQIGERAASEHSGLLIAVDEAQALGRRGLGELGMIAQTVAHGQGLPIALAFSGTPELQALLLHSGSFLERMARTELGMLTRDEARLALLEPASRQNVRFDDQALELLLAAAGGYPYFVQLGGYHAWEAALGQSAITRECADRGARAISADADRMFSDRWARLGSTQRHYLAALALLARTHPDGVATRAIADALDREHAQLSTARASLIEEHHLLRTPRRGQIEFAIPRFCAWLQEQLAAGDPRPEFSGLVPPSLGHAPDGRLTPPRT
jgi:type II secretory pathway predicted ATPase ExeA